MAGPPGTTHLQVRAPAAVARAVAHRALGPDREAWLGTAVDAADQVPGTGRWEVDLELPLTLGVERSVSLHKAAYIDVGALSEEVAAGPMCVPISWRAAGLAPLFPVFSGTLCWVDGELHLDGWYAPPGGAAGVAADRILLRLAAMRTARWLLGRVAAAMIEAQRGQSRSSR